MKTGRAMQNDDNIRQAQRELTQESEELELDYAGTQKTAQIAAQQKADQQEANGVYFIIEEQQPDGAWLPFCSWVEEENRWMQREPEPRVKRYNSRNEAQRDIERMASMTDRGLVLRIREIKQ